MARITLFSLPLLAAFGACQSRLELGRNVESAAGTGGAAQSGGGSNAGTGNSAGAGHAAGAAGAGPCAEGFELRETKVPVDVVFVLDNSSSMAENIQAFQQSISSHLVDVLDESGIDFRVILVSRYGKVGEPVGDSDNPVCIGAPLTTLDCSAPPVPVAIDSDRFFHYSADIQSNDAWCKLLNGFDTSDELPSGDRAWTPLAPNGWSAFLRAEALKSIVVISDSTADCVFGDVDFGALQPDDAAAAFDEALTSLSPAQLGTPAARRYVFHSVVCIFPNDPPSEPWPADFPAIAADCGEGASSAGVPYQFLSILTGGLRFPSCYAHELESFFRALAAGIDTQARCTPI